jgi:hypothetical protein
MFDDEICQICDPQWTNAAFAGGYVHRLYSDAAIVSFITADFCGSRCEATIHALRPLHD